MTFPPSFIYIIAGSIFCLENCLTECSSKPHEMTLGIVLKSQPNPHHNALADFKKKSLLKQTAASKVKIRIFKTHQENVAGHWTILPLLKKFRQQEEYSWFIFMEENTNINLNEFVGLLSNYNKSEDIFVGRSLVDESPTIIHHFAPAADLSYPHPMTAFFLSFSLIKKLEKKCEGCDFSIDPMYELSKYVWEAAAVKMLHDPRLCLHPGSGCASWIEPPSHCGGGGVEQGKIFVAVKTCGKYHSDRVEVVKKTWAADVKNLNFFSDVKNDSIPTIQLPVKNVLSGHCEKTLRIMKYYVHNNIKAADWIIIVDDDTLFSFHRLRKLLTCYSPEQFVAIGERYGYSVVEGSGYDYLTGGSGMVFSMPTVRLLVRSCNCPSLDSPDDMIIGLCLKNLQIPLTHSPLFHQARPSDYSKDFLGDMKHISFHKHFMIDPYDVYEKWLKDPPDHPLHSEL